MSPTFDSDLKGALLHSQDQFDERHIILQSDKDPKVRRARLAIHGSRSVLRYIWNHPANKGRRTTALARAIAFQVRGRILRRSSIVPLGKTAKLEVHLHAAGASKAVYASPPDWNEMMAWRAILRPGDLFLDVGSNAGLYSVWAHDCGAKPTAVEPDPVNAERTRNNLRINGCEGEVVEAAVGESEGTASFTTDHDSVNRVVEAPESASDAVRTVPMTTLDLIIESRTIRGAKIDVEGFEHSVLLGARSALEDGRIEVLQLEWNSMSEGTLGETRDPLVPLLEGFGYVLCLPRQESPHGLEPVDVTQLAGQHDIFAVRKDSPFLSA